MTSSSSSTSKVLKLGSLILKGNVLLSPLESVSCVGFRQLCHQQGASLTFTEMIRAQAVARNNNSALDLIDTTKNVPTGLQLMCKSADDLQRALGRIEELAYSHRPYFQNICAIDLNFGCPSKDVINEGAGPSMLKRKNKLLEIFQTLVKWKQNTKLKNIGAVGAKIRLGLNINEQKNKVYMGVIEAANHAGLDYLTVHARHAGQRSRDPVDWDTIREIKSIAQMPIIGNGDIRTAADIARIIEATGCDGVMVARAAIHNPWVLRSMHQGYSTTHETLPSMQELDTAILEYESLAAAANTKSKFVDFHRNNFNRLRTLVLHQSTNSSSNVDGIRDTGTISHFEKEVLFPKNKHFS